MFKMRSVSMLVLAIVIVDASALKKTRDGTFRKQDEQCSDGEFTCKNKKCISLSLTCNNNDDCEDSTDEDDCLSCENEDDCSLPGAPSCNANFCRACKDDTECSQGFKCQEPGYCGCTADEDCPTNTPKCYDGLCFECRTTFDCAVSGNSGTRPRCNPHGFCEEECIDETDCDANEFCDNGHCLEKRFTVTTEMTFKELSSNVDPINFDSIKSQLEKGVNTALEEEFRYPIPVTDMTLKNILEQSGKFGAVVVVTTGPVNKELADNIKNKFDAINANPDNPFVGVIDKNIRTTGVTLESISETDIANVTRKRTGIVIIGAGASGIGAAEYLHDPVINKNNKNISIPFIVLEARDRLGGRIYKKTFGDYEVEMGANWIHGQHEKDYNDTDGTVPPKFTNPVWDFNEKNPTVWVGEFTDYESEISITETGEKIESKREEVDYMGIDKSVEACVKFSKDLWDEYCKDNAALEDVEKKDLSFKDCVFKYITKNASMNRRDVAMRDAIIWEEIEFETGIFNNSLMHTLPLNNVDRIPYDDWDWFIKNGYHNFIDVKSKDFEDRIFKDRPVISVTYSGLPHGGVEVVAKQGIKTTDWLEIEAEYVVSTIPLGVLQKGDVKFNPPFSKEKLDAIKGFKMANYEIIYVQFPENFWGQKEVLFSINTDRPPSESIMTWGLNLDNDKYFPGSKMLAFHSMGPTARRIAKQDKEETKKEIDVIMKKMFGDNAREASDILVTDWTIQPYTYGSWAAMPEKYKKSDWSLVRQNEGRLYFAGEHTSYNQGYVHSAYESGIKAAKDILEKIQNKDDVENATNVRQYCPGNMY